MSRELQNDIKSDSSLKTEIFEEYLDNWRLSKDDSRSSAMLQAKYAGRRFDVVVADGSGALLLLIQHPPDFLRETPVVFVSVSDFDLPSSLPQNVTGVATHVDLAGTVQLARMLQPDLQHVYYIDSEPITAVAKSQMLHREFKELDGKVEITFWLQERLDSLFKRVSSLPPHSAILFDTYFQDPTGQTFIPAKISAEISARSNVPVYTVYKTMLGDGPVGGVVVDFEAIGHQAARMIFGLLHEAEVADMPVEWSQNRIAIDWRQFQRFHLAGRRVPNDAMIYYREPTVWEKYRWYLVFGGLIFLLQTFLIVQLAMQGKKRKQSERSTRELAGRLIHAQEEERRRIASELHDDVCQRLALVCLQLDSLRAAVPMSHETLSSELSAIYDEADMISSDIHQFSRELHPSILEKLGLVPALRRFCAEFSAHRKIVVNFASSGDEDATLVREVALVIFRVGQECLMNVSKHSCAQSCDMSLRFQRYCIVLEVTDTGKGFDPSVLKGNTGLGLQSMRERLRSVSGKLRIDSALQQGTRIYAEIPVSRIAQTAMPPQAARSDMPVT
jgi:signal transduction histidine kinase